MPQMLDFPRALTGAELARTPNYNVYLCNHLSFTTLTEVTPTITCHNVSMTFYEKPRGSAINALLWCFVQKPIGPTSECQGTLATRE